MQRRQQQQQASARAARDARLKLPPAGRRHQSSALSAGSCRCCHQSWHSSCQGMAATGTPVHQPAPAVQLRTSISALTPFQTVWSCSRAASDAQRRMPITALKQ
eukprot:13456003-Alexandrium_andersonii.AAC.1